MSTEDRQLPINASPVDDAAKRLATDGLVVVPGVLDASTVTHAARALINEIDRQIEDSRERAKYGARVSAGYTVGRLLERDDVFVDILLNPVVQALVSVALRGRGRVSSCRGWSKGQGHGAVPLHTDQKLFGVEPLGLNVTVALTPYEVGSGPLVFAPGSHRRNRHPKASEGYRGVNGEDPDELLSAWIGGQQAGYVWPAGVEPVLASPGSLIAWYGTTWHGADARLDSGRRVSLVYYFEHELLIPQEVYRDGALRVVVDHRAEELADVLGGRHPSWS